MNRSMPLARLTTIGLGGPAACLVPIHSVDDLKKAVAAERGQPVPFFVLGGGSNVVFADGGYPGTVLRMELRGIAMEMGPGASRFVTAAAGEPWDGFIEWTVARNLQGLECLSGIPGSCGATPIQNVGAYGQEVSNTIVRVETLDTLTLEPRTFEAADCRFAYRDSLFKSGEPGRYIVTAVTFKLTEGGTPDLRYAELQKAAAAEQASTLQEIRDLVIRIRRKKGMVVDAADPDSRSCGSFFTNPIVDESELPALRKKAAARGLDPSAMPVYPYKPGHVKLSAAWLIEKSGIERGLTLNGAGVSSKHALALVNRGGTAADLLALKSHVQATVAQAFGVHLEPEPILAGF